MAEQDWRLKAAAWLHAKADAQEATNRQYPKHAEVYKSWTDRVHWWRTAAADLELELAREISSYGVAPAESQPKE